MRRPLIIVGAGGHGRVVAEAAVAQNVYEVVCFVDDDDSLQGASVLGIPVAGDIEWLLTHWTPGRRVHIAVGDNAVRAAVVDRLVALGAEFATVVHPSAVVSPSAALGEGTVVMPGAVIQSGAILGRHVIVNTAASVDHDCRIGDGAHLAPGARLAGNVKVGRGTLVGVGAVVCPGVRIGEGSLIGAGAVVVRDIPDGVVAYGCPARVARPVELADGQSDAQCGA